MIGRYEIIKGDLYNIANRIKEIDENYFVVRNYKLQRFEVHSKANRGNTLCLCLPFDRLDERTLSHTRRTRVGRVADIEKELL